MPAHGSTSPTVHPRHLATKESTRCFGDLRIAASDTNNR